MSAIAPTLQAFFTQRLIGQRQASPHTIAAYRDTLRLLLTFAADQTGRQPSALDIDDLDAPLISAFLDHLEHKRGNGIRTRNARLAAIRALFKIERGLPRLSRACQGPWSRRALHTYVSRSVFHVDPRGG